MTAEQFLKEKGVEGMLSKSIADLLDEYAELKNRKPELSLHNGHIC
jgi:hypothetical protein